MGQEISNTRFKKSAFEKFRRCLLAETKDLEQRIIGHQPTTQSPRAGLELELWLVDNHHQPYPCNEQFLAKFDHPDVCAELARFSVEFNTRPVVLTGSAITDLSRQLEQLSALAQPALRSLDADLLMIGILPTLRPEHLTCESMSDLNRYRALNEQILKARADQPLTLEIVGQQSLKLKHPSVMVESAATSLQIHLESPFDQAHLYYNASIIASAAMVAIAANAPLLFGKRLWHETRIPLFEQAVESGGYGGAARGPLKRVSFGTGFARHSIMECFRENLEHFPVLLPEDLGPTSERLDYLKIHNGTIWRWNRPLVQVEGQTLSFRIEHRSPSAGPTLVDTLANCAFYYGLTRRLADHIAKHELNLTFAQARDNFYQAAQHGLDCTVIWLDGKKHNLRELLLNTLLTQAASGLAAYSIEKSSAEQYLDIIRRRVQTRQTGSQWQQNFLKNHPEQFKLLTQHYHHHQTSGIPVSEWPLN